MEATRALKRGGVVFYDANRETAEEAALRAKRGAVIVMPLPLKPEEWERMAVIEQSQLCARAAAWIPAARSPLEAPTKVSPSGLAVDLER